MENAFDQFGIVELLLSVQDVLNGIGPSISGQPQIEFPHGEGTVLAADGQWGDAACLQLVDHLDELVICRVVVRIFHTGLVEQLLVVENALHVALVRQPVLDPGVVLERFLGTVQGLFDIRILLQEVLEVQQDPGFVETGDLASLDPEHLGKRSVGRLQFHVLVMRFGVGRLELYFVFSFVLFIEGLDDRVRCRLLLGRVRHIDAEFDHGGAVGVLRGTGFPSASGKHSDDHRRGRRRRQHCH